METMTIHKAKTQTQLSRLIEKACRGEDVAIARGSKPVVRLVAIQNPRRSRKPGALKGKIQIGPEFFEPLPPKGIGALAVATSSSEYFRQLWCPATLVTSETVHYPILPVRC